VVWWVGILSYEPLSDREKRILDHFKSVEVCGFNGLHVALSGYTSRQTLRKDLDRLISMQLVHEVKGRRGQMNVYTLGETQAKFEAGLFQLMAEWKKLEDELKRLGKLVESGAFKPRKAGSMVASLIYLAAFMTASLSFDSDETFSINAKKGLLSFSAKKFNAFLDEVMTFGKEHPEIAGEFEKTSNKILKIIAPSFENTEGNLTNQTA